jgi:small subunit ribosomal protein S17
MIQKSIDERGKHKVQQGVVLSNKMDKTVVIGVTTKKAHPLYGKYVTRTRKFVAHDEKNECGVGDTVKIMETRPLSRTKRWRVVNIVEKAVLTEDPTQLM